MRKKLLILLLVMFANIGTMFASIQIDGIWYLFSSNKATVTYQGSTYSSYPDEYSGDIVIPASVTYNNVTYSVTSIGNEAFRNCATLTSVTIPNSVTSIGKRAFQYCTDLTSITIGNSVTSIGEEAFYGCSGLTSITIPNSVKSIGDYAYSGCSNASITIPNTVTNIGDNALGSVPNIVYYGSLLGSPWGAKCINGFVDGYFVYTSALKTTLMACCTSVQGDIVIPNSVTRIGERAFYNCSGLTSVTIPNSVTNIGEKAFYGCSSLTSPIYNVHVFAHMPTSYSGAYTIPDGIESIAGNAFYGCSSLTSVTISNSVTSIGSNVFQGCSSLTSVTIPNSVTSIGDYAFSGCSSLNSVTIPNSVNSIGNQAFYGCSGLTSITIPNSVTSIGKNAFSGCSNINTIFYEGSIENWCTKKWSSQIIAPTYSLYLNGEEAQNVILPNTISSIPMNVFEGCINLTSVTIPNSVTSIGDYAFSGCSSLNSISLPDSLFSIGRYAFSECINLLEVSIPHTIETIGSNAFDCVTRVVSNNENYRTYIRATPQGNLSGKGYLLVQASVNASYQEDNELLDEFGVWGYKFGRDGSHITISFPCNNTFKAGDIINIYTTKNSDIGNSMYLYSDSQGQDLLAIIPHNENAGLHSITLGEEADGLNTISLYRKKNSIYDMNPYVAYMEVVRAKSFHYNVECNNEEGAVSSSGVSDYMEKLEISAMPNYGYQFTQWSDGNTNNPRFIELMQDTTFTAEFAKNTYTITTISSNPEWGATSSDTSAFYLDTIVIVATPNKGYLFTQWSDGNTNNPRFIELTQDTTFTAEFAAIPCEKYSFNSDTTIFACEGEYISWRRYEHIPTDVPGIYYYNDSLYTIRGCDSVLSLTLAVGSPSYMIYYDTITEGYNFYPIGIVTESGIYRDTLRTMFGCDSIQEWHIHVLPALSGKCGDEAYWDLDTISGVLMISGNGAMYDYKSTTLPWRKYAQYITSAQVQEGITHLSAYAFENIRTLLNVHLPSTLETMGNMSFYCATNIGMIICDAIIPPTGGTFKGVNKDAVIYVPCGTRGAYTDSNNWGWYFPNIEDGSYEFIEDTLICYGADLNWRGQYHLPYYSDTVIYHNDNSTLYKFGGGQAMFMDSLKTMQGCDSVYVLNAYIAPHYYEIIYDTINEGESHWAVRGNILSDTVHYNYYSTILGCDSVQEWHIHVKPAPRYTISVAANSSKYGSVEGAGIYKRDTTITLTAIPNKGYQFNEWSDGNTDNPRQITITQDSTFTAIFGNKMCSWLAESNDLEMGAVVTSFNNEYYQYGTQITVEASPNSGYKFVKWNDGKKFNPYKFGLLEDKYLLAIFMEEEGEQDTTTVQPSSTSATFTWPFIVGGFSYSLTIYLDVACTIPFCTITFNQYGQLIGISFGNRAPRRSMEQEDGFTYTVSGLDANTEYYFKMETMDEDNKLINTDEGAFRTTNDATGIENQHNTVIEHRKVMINGQIYILRGDKTYTLQGQEVK